MSSLVPELSPPPPAPRVRNRVSTILLSKLPVGLTLRTVTVLGVVFAGVAFIAALLSMFGAGVEWLGAAGGLGAVALGAQQVGAAIADAEAKRRKVVSRARVIRRSLVEACNSHRKAGSMRAWLEQIGNARSLDTIQGQFRGLQDLAAELGGTLADAADRAFEKFLRAADVVNPLYARRESLPPDKDLIGERGQILTRLIEAADALVEIAPPAPDEPSIPNAVRDGAEGMSFLYGPEDEA